MRGKLSVTKVRYLLARLTRQQPYHGALLRNRLARYESGLRALLGIAVGLLGCLAWQQIYPLFDEQGHAQENTRLRNPLPAWPLPADPLLPANPLALITRTETDRTKSLFNIKQAKTHAPIALNKQQNENEADIAGTPQSIARQTIWQLQVQRSSLSDLSVKEQVATARQQLQAGNVELARQAFERVLRQDPHQVVALAGMLVVDSLRGDIQQRENDLKILRQEIPDYVPEDDLFLLQVAD